MRTRGAALATASALLTTTFTTFAGAAPAHATGWHPGWCQQDEGLSVVVDYGEIDDPTLPTEGWEARCLVGGVIEASGTHHRVAALRAVGFQVEAQNSGYVEAINGVNEFDHGMSWWMLSGTAVPGAWDLANYDIVTDGPNINKAIGARYVVDGGSDTPRTIPQFGQPPVDPDRPVAPQPDPVVSGSTPRVTGVARVGRTLTGAPGSWTVGARLGHQWKRNGHPIKGATRPNYRATAADKGKKLTLTVTGSKPGSTGTTRTSAAVTVRAGLLRAPRPRVTGKATQGRTLTARPGAWGPGKVTLSYRWLRNGKPIGGTGATRRTYRLVAKDRGKKIQVRVRGTKPGYARTVKVSAKTSKVRR